MNELIDLIIFATGFGRKSYNMMKHYTFMSLKLRVILARLLLTNAMTCAKHETS